MDSRKWYRCTYFQGRNRDTDIENKHVGTVGEGEQDWLIYTTVCKIDNQSYPVCESCSVMSDSLWSHGLYSPWYSPSQNTGVGSLSILQRIFPTRGSNPGLLHCRQILYQLSPQGSPRFPSKTEVPTLGCTLGELSKSQWLGHALGWLNQISGGRTQATFF